MWKSALVHSTSMFVSVNGTLSFSQNLLRLHSKSLGSVILQTNCCLVSYLVKNPKCFKMVACGKWFMFPKQCKVHHRPWWSIKLDNTRKLPHLWAVWARSFPLAGRNFHALGKYDGYMLCFFFNDHVLSLLIQFSFACWHLMWEKRT